MRRAIDGRQRLNLHVVFDHGHAGLDDLVLRAVVRFGESESIAAHNDTVLQGDPIADLCEFANRDMGMSGKVVANAAALIDDHVRMNNRIGADRRIRPHDNIGADGAPWPIRADSDRPQRSGEFPASGLGGW